MKLAAAAPRYGWTDIVYSLVPNGHHSQYPDDLPAFDGSDSTHAVRHPEAEHRRRSSYGDRASSARTLPAVRSTRRSRCLYAPDPFETEPAVPRTRSPTSCPSSSATAPPTTRTTGSRGSRPTRATGSRSSTPARSPTRCSRRSRTCACRTGSRRRCPGYPIQQYFGDYQHFVQNKAKEWGDLCGADHHVCTFADYPGGDVNATPTGLVRTGVTTRLNRFIDHYAQPPGNPSEPQPSFDVTAALQICPQNASARVPGGRAGRRRSRAGSFVELAPHTLRLDIGGTQTTTNDAEPNPHAVAGGPAHQPVRQRRPLPGPRPRRPGPAWPSTTREPLAERATMIGATQADRRLHGLHGARACS